LVERYNHTGLPELYAGANFKETDWRCPKERGWDPQASLPDPERFFSYLEGLTPQSRGFLFWGSVGCGKTHICALAAHHLLSRGFNVHWVHWPRALEQGKAGMRSRSQAWPPENWANADFLILDEIGVPDEESRWARASLTRLLAARHDQGLKGLLATSNSRPRELKEALLAPLYDRIGQLAWSRPIVGPSWRTPFTVSQEAVADGCPI